jgi:macrolide-specific efflux system membrane fusion protein
MVRGTFRKVIPVLAVLVALAIVGFGVYTEFSSNTDALPAQPKFSNLPTHIPTHIPSPTAENKPPYTVQRGDVSLEVTLTGQITSAAKQELFFRTQGPVDKILVKLNDRVKTGQLLANLYLSQTQFDLQRAQINLDIDKLNLAMAQQQPKPVDPNTQPITLAIAQKQIDLANLNIQEINATITDMQIFSPVDGTVTEIYMKEGDKTSGFEPVIEVADLNILEVTVSPLGEDLPGLAVNTPVTVRTTKNPDQVLNGVITSLPPIISATNVSTQNSDDLIHIALNENPLSAGYQYGDQVQVSVVTESKNNVLWLPPSAITTTGGHSYVTIQDDQGQHQVEVKLGLQTDSQVEILSGVKEGQGVYTPY